jgi:hypothetical protein
MAGYELSEAAVRKLAEIVRAYSAGRLGTRTAPPASPRRDAPYTPEFYRLAVNAGDGAYTLRKQEWDADADEMIDLADEFDGDYDLDIDGFDYQGRADGVAGAVGVGQIVPGWRLFIDDAWITLVDVGGGTADSPLTLGPSASDMANLSWSPTTNLDAADWDRKDQGANDGVKIPICVRYHLSASLTMHHIMRDFTFDNQGALRSIGAESLINRNMDGNP